MRVLLPICLMLGLTACVDKPPDNDPGGQERVTFQFLHASHNERFQIATSNPDLIRDVRAELAKPQSERFLHPNGVLQHGDGGVNMPWSWSIKEDEWNLAELSAEVCDAWPGEVESNVDLWVENPGFFCPWGARVESEVE